MNRFNPSSRAILLAVLTCVSITLLLFTFRVNTVRRWCSTLNWIKTIGDSSRRHYNTSDEMHNGTGDQFSPDHQQTVDYIRRHISHPSLTRPRQLVQSDRKDASQHGQSAFVDKLLSRRRDGFFVECGAGDGEFNSNSLFFELQRNWTGLLIEVSADDHRALLNKNRRASVLRACLSPERRPGKYQLRRGPFTGVVDTKHQVHLPFIGNNSAHDVEVDCFPLNSVMAAVDVSHIDYFSLDVEGLELLVLGTVDWTRLRIDVLTVEYRVVDRRQQIDIPATLKKLNDLRRFFRDTGIYHEVGILPIGDE